MSNDIETEFNKSKLRFASEPKKIENKQGGLVNVQPFEEYLIVDDYYLVIRLIDIDKKEPENFTDRQCLIKYKNYEFEEYLIANDYYDDCFWFKDNSLPVGREFIQCYAFLQGV